jgi:hypothetical protein
MFQPVCCFNYYSEALGAYVFVSYERTARSDYNAAKRPTEINSANSK